MEIHMKRRTFVSSLALLAAAGLPFRARAAQSDELPILSRTGQPLLLKRAEVNELKAALRGTLLLGGDEGYEQARHIWNGAFDKRPAAIVRCADAADARLAVQFASSHDLLVAVRGGGHSLPGHSVCEGGLMIDLAPMQGIRVDAASRLARVEPGVLLGTMDRAAQTHGLIVPAGTVSHTGVAGLSLGGGFGRLSRKLGLTVDSLLAAEVITADGRTLRASADDNADLFWALRGGGGNFGVVTAFEFRMHPIAANLVGGDLVYPIEQAPSLLAALAEFSARASNELWVDPVLECDEKGERRLMVNLCHCGDARRAGKDVAALRKLGKPIRDTVGARPFATLQSEHDVDSPHGRSYYMTGGLVQSLKPALLTQVVECIQRPGAEMAKISITQHGGAIGDVPVDATAFANRSASHTVVLRASWNDRSHAKMRTEWQKETWKTIAPFTQGIYANLNFGDADPRIVGAYGPNLPRLMELKTRFDPKNLFHLNPNIKPRAA
jgi:FAD/FMN-containing dehydrogenase